MKFNARIGCISLAISLGGGVAEAQQAVKHIQTANSLIASAVWAGDTLYVSGTLPTAITPPDPAKGTPGVYGDTHTQALSALQNVEKILKEQGLSMSDVVMMHTYLAGDPANGGKLDFAGWNSAYSQYFGTKEQPNKPARSTFQVAALALPGGLVEVEVIAVRAK